MLRLVLPCLLAMSGVLASAATAGAAEFVPGELIVRFKPGVSGPERAGARRDRGATVVRALPLAGTQVLELPAGQGVRRAAAAFADDPRVLYAEPNYVVRAHDLSTVVDDPFANELWGLDNEQQRGGLLDADIDALEGWGVQPTSPAVKVAVLDSGVDLLHPDLRLQLENGRDFVDDDFVPQDEDGHGTHVAGTVGARGNDAVGLTGVSRDVRIVPVRVLDEFGQGTDAEVVSGIAFAAAAGASVVNLSLGGSGLDYPDAVHDAIKQNPGILFVVSAGNSGRNNDVHGDWPCNYAPDAGDVDNVICVAASNTNDAPAGFSNYGPNNVDIAAPGVGIGSTQPQSVRFTEGFDTGLGAWQGQTPPAASTWQTSATAASGGSAAGLAIDPDDPEYPPASDTTLRTAAAIDLVGYHACSANFDLRLNVDDGGGDAFSVEAATDPNGTWTEVYRRATDEPAFTRVHAPLPSAFDDKSVYLRVRFATDGTNPAGGGPFTGPEVDRFEVLCPEWAFMSGTSMATPHVSGAAALVLAQSPALTTAQLRERLLSTGDQSACWTGLTTTGARLNLARALELANLGSGPTASSCPVTVAQQEALKGAAPTPTPAPPPSPAPPAGTDTATPAPIDDDGPVVTASAARRHRASTLLARGLRARIGCDEECTLRADILIGRRTAKKLGITGRRFGSSYIVVGRSRSGLSRAGSKTVITRISRGAHRGLRRARSVRLVLRVLARDELGNTRVTRRTLTVRR